MITVLVPSRGRPDNIRDLLESFNDTCVNATTRLYVVIDEDDEESGAYMSLCHELMTARPKIEFRMKMEPTRLRLGATLNKHAPLIAMTNRDTAIGFMGDDHRPRTVGWDKTIDDLFLDTVNTIAYGDDLFQGARLPTAVFMDPRIVRRLGYFVLPGQIHLWMDNYWMKLGQELGTLRYLPDVIIEHMHPHAGKAETDKGYAEANAGAVWENDERIYKAWEMGQMANDVRKINA